MNDPIGLPAHVPIKEGEPVGYLMVSGDFQLLHVAVTEHGLQPAFRLIGQKQIHGKEFNVYGIARTDTGSITTT